MINKIKYSSFYDLILPFYQWLEIIFWIRRNTNPPTPHLIKQNLIIRYSRNYKLKTFVETGTYLGVMSKAMSNHFSKIYTIEINRKIFEITKIKLKNKKNITIINGDSAVELKDIISKLKRPAIFWLDAHYSGGITSKGKDNSPIIKELKRILESKIKNNVVLIDDAHLFVGKLSYPTISELRNITRNKYEINVENSVIILTPKCK